MMAGPRTATMRFVCAVSAIAFACVLSVLVTTSLPVQAAGSTPALAAAQFESDVQARFTHNIGLFPHTDRPAFIHGQGVYPQSLLQISADGNGTLHGCGPISLHNALIYAADGESVVYGNIAGIVRHLELNGGFNFGGLWGTNPIAMVSFLRYVGFENTRITYLPSRGRVDAMIRNSPTSVSILLYGGDREMYIHYVAIHWDGVEFHVYNWRSNDTHAHVFGSVQEWIADRGYTTLALIVVE